MAGRLAFVRHLESPSCLRQRPGGLTAANALGGWQMPVARRMLPAHVEVAELETDDAWLRDVGPTFIEETDGHGRRTRLAGWDWTFNAWGGADGGCYSSWTRDDAAASALLRRMEPQVGDPLQWLALMQAMVCDGPGSAPLPSTC